MKVVIIGAGPAGIFAAIAASKTLKNYSEKANKPSQVFLIEKNEKVGKKLFITGKGRCNLTNDCDKSEFFDKVVTNSKFLYSAYSAFSNKDLMNFIEDFNCPLKIERGKRVFPISDKSYDVIDALKKALKHENVNIMLNSEVSEIIVNNDNSLVNSNHNETFDDNTVCCSINNINLKDRFVIKFKDKKTILADRIVIATGGLSYKSTGSTGDGYKFAKSFDIKVNSVSPSLVPFNLKEIDECKNLQGLTLKNVSIKIIERDNKEKIIYSDFGELLFTHFGVSGPIILSASSYIDLKFENDDQVIDNKFKYSENDLLLSIDLKPALSSTQLDNRLLRDFNNNPNKKLKSILEELLPSSLAEVFIKRLDDYFADEFINKISDIRTSDVTKHIRKKIIELLKDFRFNILTKRSFDEAVVTHGGIDVKEINPKNMESKRINGLYFAGEVIDVDALTGGFNIQIAASTGYLAGKSAGNI